MCWCQSRGADSSVTLFGIGHHLSPGQHLSITWTQPCVQHQGESDQGLHAGCWGCLPATSVDGKGTTTSCGKLVVGKGLLYYQEDRHRKVLGQKF